MVVKIKEYFLLIETQEFKDTLLFCKLYHKSRSFVNLAKLAQRALGVPATSADVERMFSLSGHILGLKRRTTGSQKKTEKNSKNDFRGLYPGLN